MFNADELANQTLIGQPPLMDSFFATIDISRIGFPPEVGDWIERFRIIPAFMIYGFRGNYSYYRINAGHEYLRFPHEADTCQLRLHIGYDRHDFLVTFLSKDFLERTEFYECYASYCTLSQVRKGETPLRGNACYFHEGKTYLHLHHHTTKEGKKGILVDKFFESSFWNFCGTRRMSKGHCYFTDIPQANSSFDTLPILIRSEPGSDVVFRTDDQAQIASAGIQIDDRMLDHTISFLISREIIQPNPMIRHHPIDGQPKWLEIDFPHIYRIPCSGIRLEKR